MKKVVFSVIKAGKNEVRTSGVGYITETDLLIPAISRNGKPYIRVFEDCIRYCHKIPNENNEFKGTFWELREVEFEQRSYDNSIKNNMASFWSVLLAKNKRPDTRKQKKECKFYIPFLLQLERLCRCFLKSAIT